MPNIINDICGLCVIFGSILRCLRAERLCVCMVIVLSNYQTMLQHPLANQLSWHTILMQIFMYNMLDGKSITGCLHFVNKTPIIWYSKKQSPSETATYGANSATARACFEHIIDLRQSFRYLGVPVRHVSYIFGDNKAMVESYKFPYVRLNKRHNILPFHFVRNLISKGFISINHINL